VRYKLFGRTGLRVSELCLGTMTFGEEWQFGASSGVSRAMFDAFCSAGGNFIDTANAYTYGTSETFVGDLISADRDYFVVSTKFSLNTRVDDLNSGGNHRKCISRSIESSLRRLKTDYIDIYWLHAWDFSTPIEDVMRGLEDLVSSGKVLYLGISNTPAWLVSQANMSAELRGWAKFIGYQAEYNLIERTAERDVLPMSQALGLGLLAWSPLAGGVLSGKYVLDGSDVHISDSKRGNWLNSERLTRRALEIAGTVIQIAEELGRPPSQVALNWIRQRPNEIIPIIAARTVGQMHENLKCLEFCIDKTCMDRLVLASKISLGYPHHFLSSDPLKSALFGDKRDLVDLGTQCGLTTGNGA